MITKNNRKTINAWCMYDWANSVYSLVITTAVFPSYYYGVTGGKGAVVPFFGLEANNAVLYTYTLSTAFILVALLNPLLSSIADYSGNKKKFMKFFCYMGAAACSLLFFFESDNVELGVISFGVAAVGWAGSLVFYNSYLPEIATEDQFDRVSAKGFSLGYIGSVLLLIVNLLMIQKKSWFGIPETNGVLAAQISFLMVGVWWAGFAQVTFINLPNNIHQRKPRSKHYIQKGYQELHKVWKEAKQFPLIRKYLIGFFFFSMGVQTVMYLATIFGEEVVNLQMSELIILVIIIQIVAIPGAYFFSYLSSKKGNVFSLITAILIWIAVCVFAYFLREGWKTEYFITGFFVGFVMGGIQSLSRSTYSKLIPEHTINNASFFSFYETLEKISIALGTFVFGLVLQLTQDMNTSALSMGGLFVIGLFFMFKMPMKLPKRPE